MRKMITTICVNLSVLSFITALCDTTLFAARNSIYGVKQTLIQNDLTAEEIRDVKNLFFSNLGFIHIDILRDIYITYSAYVPHIVEHGETMDTDDVFAPTTELVLAALSFKSIVEFRDRLITEENFDEVQREWSESLGRVA